MLTLGVCPEGGPMSAFPFGKIYSKVQDISKKGIEGCDTVLFWGGTDIHPYIYGAKCNRLTRPGDPNGPSKRDEFEIKAMKWCVANNIPMIGICRGAQLACAFAGGSLAQHVTGHGAPHMISTLNDGEVLSTSSHHQMMNLSGSDGQLLAWSSKRLSTCYRGEGESDIVAMQQAVEPEIAWFPSTRTLAIQGHPEWCRDEDQEFPKLCQTFVRRYCLGEAV